ncbi:MAG TPA: long-chain fatty acid--CoA ligase [Pyrinomonadaceae bacterium]|nr:long-chain fatty acid--CoA ligase [Pyrinomonadaceae bacterium]
MLNLAVLLEDSARNVPDRTAVICGEAQFTYAEINAKANQIANALRGIGIEKGDKIALSCANLPFFPMIYYGILKAGATVVPLNILLKGREIAYHLTDSDARIHFCFEGTKELPIGEEGFKGFTATDTCEKFILLTLDPRAESPYENTQTFWQFIEDQPETFESEVTDETETAVILYTSGTTGQPKGAELTHLNVVLNARLSDTMYPRRDADVHLLTLPLFHSFGQVVQMNAGFYNQATLVLLPRFSAEDALRLMDKHDVTIFAGVPTMYWALLNYEEAEKFDLEKISRNLRLCKSGGASLPVEVLKGFEEKFKTKITEGYGLSETSPVAVFNRYGETRPGAIGFPVWGVQVRIVDENCNDVADGEIGEIIIRGHCVMKGYYKRPEATAATIKNGWLHSGDVGRRDREGYIYISDRVKDMILRGGFNVYPRELEEVLMTHEAVSLCAVVGVKSDEHGEEIKAFIVKKDGAAATETEIVEWCKANMASYKYPRFVEFRDSLPMTATGKILKRELR